jgi:trans-L-3-hydroxyproline dehydratase
VGEHDAVIPEIEGRAFITGRNEILIDPEDPLARGFLLR